MDRVLGTVMTCRLQVSHRFSAGNLIGPSATDVPQEGASILLKSAVFHCGVWRQLLAGEQLGIGECR